MSSLAFRDDPLPAPPTAYEQTTPALSGKRKVVVKAGRGFSKERRREWFVGMFRDKMPPFDRLVSPMMGADAEAPPALRHDGWITPASLAFVDKQGIAYAAQRHTDPNSSYVALVWQESATRRGEYEVVMEPIAHHYRFSKKVAMHRPLTYKQAAERYSKGGGQVTTRTDSPTEFESELEALELPDEDGDDEDDGDDDDDSDGAWDIMNSDQRKADERRQERIARLLHATNAANPLPLGSSSGGGAAGGGGSSSNNNNTPARRGRAVAASGHHDDSASGGGSDSDESHRADLDVNFSDDEGNEHGSDEPVANKAEGESDSDSQRSPASPGSPNSDNGEKPQAPKPPTPRRGKSPGHRTPASPNPTTPSPRRTAPAGDQQLQVQPPAQGKGKGAKGGQFSTPSPRAPSPRPPTSPSAPNASPLPQSPAASPSPGSEAGGKQKVRKKRKHEGVAGGVEKKAKGDVDYRKLLTDKMQALLRQHGEMTMKGLWQGLKEGESPATYKAFKGHLQEACSEFLVANDGKYELKPQFK